MPPDEMFPDLLRDDVFRLETSRLWLRWPRLSDAGALARLGGDPAVALMTASLPQPYRVEDAAKWIFASRTGNARGHAAVLALAHKARPAEPIGVIGLHATRAHVALLGFWLGGPFQGAGLMSEAAGALLDLAFAVGEIGEVHAQARVENAASIRVLEKCGFQPDGRSPVDLPMRGGVFLCDRFKRARDPGAGVTKTDAGALAAG
ncbi:MAG: acetyltransferase family protein [Hyphomicrobiales bacterium]|nr:acetyltransferase family protein [Hyphomicrobiales bacterium]